MKATFIKLKKSLSKMIQLRTQNVVDYQPNNKKTILKTVEIGITLLVTS